MLWIKETLFTCVLGTVFFLLISGGTVYSISTARPFQSTWYSQVTRNLMVLLYLADKPFHLGSERFLLLVFLSDSRYGMYYG